jgi:3',5'-cyclic AMP phosphodiesterase CpdA
MKAFKDRSFAGLFLTAFLISSIFPPRSINYHSIRQTLSPRWWIPLITHSKMASGGEAQVLIAAGDIVSCVTGWDEQTAALVEQIPGTVATLGDTVYASGTAEEFANCFTPSWGRFKDRTRPAAGNHDYETSGAQPYFSYFGPAAGEDGKGYYSYDLGSWHIVVLNSNCSELAGGCTTDSPQVQWLRADLSAHPALCSLAYWHHPAFASGEHGNHRYMRDIWQALDDHGVELVLSGHDHNYERFAPQDANGSLDEPGGIVQFVVGTGGIETEKFPSQAAQENSLVRNDQTFGVLKLLLYADHYAWEFVGIPGSTFTDTGSSACHP